MTLVRTLMSVPALKSDFTKPASLFWTAKCIIVSALCNKKKTCWRIFLSPHGNCDDFLHWKYLNWCYKFDLQIADKTKISAQMGKNYLIHTMYWKSVFHKSIVLSMSSNGHEIHNTLYMHNSNVCYSESTTVHV